MISVDDDHTTCEELRATLNKYLQEHCCELLDTGERFIDNIRSNLKSLGEPEETNDEVALKRYIKLMSDATPGECQYGTFLELHVFAHATMNNVVVYHLTPYRRNVSDDAYQQLAIFEVNQYVPTIALLYDCAGQHYQALFAVESIAGGVACISRTNFTTADQRVSNKSTSESRTERKVSEKDNGNDGTTNPKTIRKASSGVDSAYLGTKKINRLITHLNGMKKIDLQSLYDNVSVKLKRRNGYVVDFNHLLTAILGCNTNTLLLGGTEQSKGAAFYLGPYMQKNKTDLNESIDIVLEATEHAHKYPSVAEDKATNDSFNMR